MFPWFSKSSLIVPRSSRSSPGVNDGIGIGGGAGGNDSKLLLPSCTGDKEDEAAVGSLPT